MKKEALWSQMEVKLMDYKIYNLFNTTIRLRVCVFWSTLDKERLDKRFFVRAAITQSALVTTLRVSNIYSAW